MVCRITYLFLELDCLGAALAFLVFSASLIVSLLKSHASGHRPFFDCLRLLLDALEALWSWFVATTLFGMLLLFTVEILCIIFGICFCYWVRMEEGSIFHEIGPESHVSSARFLVFFAWPPSGHSSLRMLIRLVTAHRSGLEIRGGTAGPWVRLADARIAMMSTRLL